jgi:hypothetical protein
MNILSQILEHKIVAIIRGAKPDDVLKIAEALAFRRSKFIGGHSKFRQCIGSN